MSNPEKARELHAEGWGYKRIAKHFGVSRDRARDWVNLERRRRLNKNRWQSGICAVCGGPKVKPTNPDIERPCMPCQTVEKERRWGEIQELWNYKECSRHEIAERLGLTLGSLMITMHRMRRAGWHLPYADGYPRLPV